MRASYSQAKPLSKTKNPTPASPCKSHEPLLPVLPRGAFGLRQFTADFTNFAPLLLGVFALKPRENHGLQTDCRPLQTKKFPLQSTPKIS